MQHFVKYTFSNTTLHSHLISAPAWVTGLLTQLLAAVHEHDNREREEDDSQRRKQAKWRSIAGPGDKGCKEEGRDVREDVTDQVEDEVGLGTLARVRLQDVGLDDGGGNLDTKNVDELADEGRHPRATKLDGRAKHDETTRDGNKSGPDDLETVLGAPLLALLEGTASQVINGRTSIGLADESTNQTGKTRQTNVQDGKVEAGLENERDLGRNTDVHHVGNTEPERSQSNGRETQQNKGARKDEEERVLLVASALGDVNAVAVPEGRLGLVLETSTLARDLADVNRLGQEENLHQQTDTHKDERDPLGSRPAQALVLDDGTTDEDTKEGRDDNGQRRDTNLLSLFMPEELQTMH